MSKGMSGIYSEEMRSVFKEKKYEDFVNETDYKEFCDYLKLFYTIT